jgi:hypothetical protein
MLNYLTIVLRVLLVILLSIILFINYSLYKKTNYLEFLCHKGKVIKSIDNSGVYLEFSGMSCEHTKGMLIFRPDND